MHRRTKTRRAAPRWPLGLSLALILASSTPIAAHPRARRLKRPTSPSSTVTVEDLKGPRAARNVAIGAGGALWALDGSGGLWLRRPSSGRWEERAVGRPSGNSRHLAPWFDRIALAGPFQGVTLVQGTHGVELDPDSPPGRRRVRALAVHHDDLWVASVAGLIRYADPGKSQFIPLPEELSGAPSALASTGDRLLVGDDQGGVAVLKAGNWKVLTPGETGESRITAVAAWGSKIYIGSSSGVREYSLPRATFTELAGKNSALGALHVSALAIRANELWVATLGQGVFRRNATEAWTQLATGEDGWPSPHVRGLVTTPNQAVVAATDRGVVRVSLSASEESRYQPRIPKTDVPPASDLSRPDPMPSQRLHSLVNGGELSPLAALGDILFEDPTILGERARRMGISCGTCHPRGHTNTNLFIKGISIGRGGVDLTNRHFSAAVHNGVLDPVDSPSLRGLRHTGPYGRTQQAPDIRKFTRNVIVLEFEGAEPDNKTLDALVAYQREFNFLPARWVTPQGQLTKDAPGTVRRGEALFEKTFPGLPGGSCASCHRPDAHFTDGRMHDIGTGDSFDTPTLRNALYSPPYMHDGRFATFSEVLDFFQKTYSLGLTAGELRDLEAYLRAVGEGLDPYE